jgi:hypothetical protein
MMNKAPDLGVVGGHLWGMPITKTDEMSDLRKLANLNRKPLKLHQLAKTFDNVELDTISELGRKARQRGIVILKPDHRARNLAKLIPSSGEQSFSRRAFETGRELLDRYGKPSRQVVATPLVNHFDAKAIEKVIDAGGTPGQTVRLIKELNPDVIVEIAPKGEGGSVKPKAPPGGRNVVKKVVGSLPFIGASLDIYAAGEDFADGDHSSGLAHLGDAALGLTGVGEILNIGGMLYTGGESDGFISALHDGAGI